MELREAIFNRKSIRKYETQPIEDEDIKEMIEFAIQAPSASNKQMWYFVAVKNKEKLKAMSKAVSNKINEIGKKASVSEKKIEGIKSFSTFFDKAPVTIAVFRENYESGTDKILQKAGYDEKQRDRLRARPDIQSIGAAIQNLLLAAYQKGYGSCWMSAPVIGAPEIERILEMPQDKKLVALIPIGRPKENPRKTSRKPLGDVLKILE